jgi:hypothetical protein
MPFLPTDPRAQDLPYQPPPLTAEARVIAILHAWGPFPAELATLIEMQIIEARLEAVAAKESQVLALVALWERAFASHDRQGEHNAVGGIAHECGGEIAPFRGIRARG